MAYSKSLHGVDGSVTIPAAWTDLTVGVEPGGEIKIFEWHMQIVRELLEDSNFEGTDNWETVVGGMYHGVGSFLAVLQQGQATALADLVTKNAAAATGLVLITETGNSYACAAILGSIQTVVNKPQRVIITCGFESHGTITVT